MMNFANVQVEGNVLALKALEGKLHIPNLRTGKGDLTSKFSSLYSDSKPNNPNFRPGNLLKKFVEEIQPNRLLLQIYSGDKQYSLFYKQGNDCEEIELDTEYDVLLSYIDKQQLIPCLIEDFNKVFNLFYDGCVIVEINDFRSGDCEPSYTILKPTEESVMEISRLHYADDHSVSEQKVQHLESFFTMWTAPPLCLDPSPSVAIAANAMQHANNLFSSWSWKHSGKRMKLCDIFESTGREEVESKCRKRCKAGTYNDTSETSKLTDSESFPCRIPEALFDEGASSSTENCQLDVQKISEILRRQVSPDDNEHIPELGVSFSEHSKRVIEDVYFLEELTMKYPKDKTVVKSAKMEVIHAIGEGRYYVKLISQAHGGPEVPCPEVPYGLKKEAEEFVDRYTLVFTEDDTLKVRKTHTKRGKKSVISYTSRCYQQPPVKKQVSFSNPISQTENSK